MTCRDSVVPVAIAVGPVVKAIGLVVITEEHVVMAE